MTNQTIDFIGIGSGRSGSTWLSKCLHQHPDILFPRPDEKVGYTGALNEEIIKEMDFFTGLHDKRDFENSHLYTYGRGFDWYLRQFPAAEPGKIRGEFSPIYFVDPLSPQFIHDVLPNVKLLAILRNPVDLVYSYYLLRSNSIEFGHKFTFEQAIDRGYLLNRGEHHQNLSRFLKLFPREQFHVMRFDQIKENPAELVRGAYEFLGVRSDFVPAALHQKVNATKKVKHEKVQSSAAAVMGAMNRFGLKRVKDQLVRNAKLYSLYCRFNTAESNYQPMNPSTRRRLIDHYRPDIERLEQLLNWDLTNWKQ
ncbi:MAG: sulfotransferase [Patescibacteria group bacterium]